MKTKYVWIITNVDNFNVNAWYVKKFGFPYVLYFDKYENAIHYMEYINGVYVKNNADIMYNMITQIEISEHDDTIKYMDIHPLTGEIITF